MSYLEKIKAPGPKKILALDGGGIRGMMTVEILAGIEEMLRKALNRGEDFVLGDFFDYVAGTSTGSHHRHLYLLRHVCCSDPTSFTSATAGKCSTRRSSWNRCNTCTRKEKLAEKLQEVLRDKKPARSTSEVTS